MDPHNITEEFNINYYWNDSSGIVPKQGFIDSCLRLSEVGVTCTEVDIAHADLTITAQYGVQDSCRTSAMVTKDTDNGGKPGLYVFASCIPETTDKRLWIREVFTNLLGVLFGVEGMQNFCGEGNFNYVVRQQNFQGPYHTSLTDADRSAWLYRIRKSALLGNINDYAVCLPETRRDASCASVEPMAGEPFTVRVYADDEQVQRLLVSSCAFWSPFGVDCVLSDAGTAQVVITTTGQGLGALGLTTLDSTSGLWKVQVRSLSDAVLSTVLSHEMGHVFGMEHVPAWCAVSIMNPGAAKSPAYMTQGDSGAWSERYRFNSVFP